jgi:hypothetical protein
MILLLFVLYWISFVLCSFRKILKNKSDLTNMRQFMLKKLIKASKLPKFYLQVSFAILGSDVKAGMHKKGPRKLWIWPAKHKIVFILLASLTKNPLNVSKQIIFGPLDMSKMFLARHDIWVGRPALKGNDGHFEPEPTCPCRFKYG